MKSLPPVFALAIGCCLLAGVTRPGEKSIAIDVPVRVKPVDFDAEIAPILRANCIACHNEKKDSGSLILESPQSILKGGEHGPAVVPGKGAESLLLKSAAHQSKPIMPPANNKVEAKALTPAQLGLLKLWIDQGAAGSATANRDIRFQPLPDGYQPAFAAALTPDGQYAACSRGNRLFVYHLPTAKLAATLADPAADSAAHRDVIRSLAFDRAGDLLASGGFREIKLWRRPRLRQLAEWSHEAPVQCVALSADGKLAATGDDSGRLRIWDIGSNKTLKSIAAHQAAVTGIAFASDSATLYSCSLDKSLRAWQVADGAPVGKAITMAAPLHALTPLKNSAWLVTGDANGLAQVWGVQTFHTDDAKPIHEIKAHGKSITALAAVHGAEGEMYSASADGLVRRWNVALGKQLREIYTSAPVVALAVRPDGQRIATAGPDFVKLWDNSTAKPVATLQGDPRLAAKIPVLDGEIALAKSAIMRDKQDLKSYEGLERAVKVRGEDLKKAEMELVTARKMRDDKKAAASKAEAGSKGAPAAIKAVAEAETAVTVAESNVERAQAIAKRTTQNLANAEQAIVAREVALKKQEAVKVEAVAAAKLSRQPVRSLAFSTDNQRLAAGCENGAVHLYDASTGLALESPTANRSAVRALAFTGNATLVTASADHRALVWDASSQWRLVRIIGGLNQPDLLNDRVLALDFSCDGKWLASGGGAPSRFGEIKIWNVADGQLVRTIKTPHADTVFGVRFSPDGRRLASASADRFVKVFDAGTGESLRVFTGHTAHVLGVSWSGDGKLLVSGGADNVLKLWDFDKDAFVRTMKGGVYGNGLYKREVTAVTFIGASEEILAVSGDGTVRLHRVSSENEILKFADAKSYQYAVAVTPDGQTVIAAGSDGVLRVWSGHDQRPRQTFAP